MLKIIVAVVLILILAGAVFAACRKADKKQKAFLDNLFRERDQ